MQWIKGDANGHRKVEKALQKSPFLNKQVGGRRHFGFLQNASRLFCPSLGDVGKLQKLRKLPAAEIMKSF